MNKSDSNLTARLVGFALCLITLAIYWPMGGFEFVNYDDPLYVTDNPAVAGGLTWKGLHWAFLSGDPFAGMPLTTLSYLVDSALFGLSARAFHLTNLLLHLANTVLCFAFLRWLTGALWRSALVAALFAWHPLHVEAVAWVSGRKDLVCTFFSLLVLWAYGRYATIRSSARASKPQIDAKKWYGLALVLFVCALMGKATAITLPFLLLLLDFWPLGRVSGFSTRRGSPSPEDAEPNKQGFAQLLLEKVPFLVITLIAAAVSFRIMNKGGGIVAASQVPLPQRAGNAVISYVRYLAKTFWPNDLAVYYPYPAWAGWQIAGAVLVMSGLTLLVVGLARSRPYLAVGWCWFLGTLVPVLGLVQTGSHSMADRYAYLPVTGLFVLLAWAAGGGGRRAKPVLVGAAAMVLVGCLSLTWFQLRHWHDSETLFRHALRVITGNYIAHVQLGMALSQKGKAEEALSHYAASLEIAPDFAQAHNNLGAELANQGRMAEAEAQFMAALRVDPNYAPSLSNLAALMNRQGKPGQAIVHYQLGVILAGRKQTGAAIARFREAVRLKPDWLEALNNLAWILATQPDEKLRNGGESVRLAARAVELTKTNNPGALDTLAAAYAEVGRFSDAADAAQKATGLAAAAGQTDLATEIQKRRRLYDAGRAFRE